MPLPRVITSRFRPPYEQYNELLKNQAESQLAFGIAQPNTAENIETNLRNELSYTLNEDPATAKNILTNAIKGEKLSPSHQQALVSAGVDQFQLQQFREENILIRQETQRAVNIVSSVGSFAVAAGFKLAGNAAANQAVTSGQVVQFESQQQTFNNIKRATGLIGTAGTLAFGLATGGTGFIVGAILAAAGQAINYYVTNDRISAKQERQDLNAAYYQQTFGNIVRRGNR